MYSIIIPTYNGAQYLLQFSLASLLRQTYHDWEAIIVIDGSSDQTTETLYNLVHEDKRFRVFSHPENLGLAAALNHGVAMARGESIFILEHDDIWLPDKLLKQGEILRKGAGICISAAIIYHLEKSKFIKLHLSNLSCWSFSQSYSKLLFPLPEENKKYLGIEDFILHARIQTAIAAGKLHPDKVCFTNEILTIINASKHTLSGVRDSSMMAKRYQNAVDFFSKLPDYPKKLQSIKTSKRRKFFHGAMTYIPEFINKGIYLIVGAVKEMISCRKVRIFKNSNSSEYNMLLEYRNSFGKLNR